MKLLEHPVRSRGRISAPVVASLAGIAVVIAIAIYLLYPQPEPQPIPEPAPTRPLETVAPAENEEERGDSARDLIAELKANPDGVDYEAAFARGQEFYEAGRLADAQLLYFFAARGGYGPAALELGTMYDPNNYPDAAGFMEKPDPFQAYKWYRDAEAAGEEAATEQLAELRAWTEQAAQADDPEAERLLLQWE